jgi:hypothetical protein
MKTYIIAILLATVSVSACCALPPPDETTPPPDAGTMCEDTFLECGPGEAGMACAPSSTVIGYCCTDGNPTPTCAGPSPVCGSTDYDDACVGGVPYCYLSQWGTRVGPAPFDNCTHPSGTGHAENTTDGEGNYAWWCCAGSSMVLDGGPN